MKVGLASLKVGLASLKVGLAGLKVVFAGLKVGLAGLKVVLASLETPANLKELGVLRGRIRRTQIFLGDVGLLRGLECADQRLFLNGHAGLLFSLFEFGFSFLSHALRAVQLGCQTQFILDRVP